jgi:hypothetical protein
MAFEETHVSPTWVGIGALGLFRLASMEGSPGKLNIVVPSVKKSTYFEPTTCTSLSVGLLSTEEAPCDAEEVADKAFVADVALSVGGATIVDVAVVEAVTASAAGLDAVEEGVELAVSAGVIAAASSVVVALVDVAVSAATKSVLNAQTVRLERRTLATENARTLFFIKLG